MSGASEMELTLQGMFVIPLFTEANSIFRRNWKVIALEICLTVLSSAIPSTNGLRVFPRQAPTWVPHMDENQSSYPNAYLRRLGFCRLMHWH